MGELDGSDSLVNNGSSYREQYPNRVKESSNGGKSENKNQKSQRMNIRVAVIMLIEMEQRSKV